MNKNMLFFLMMSIVVFSLTSLSVSAEEVSFSRVIDQQSNKKTNLGPVNTSGTICENGDFGWFIKSYTCKTDSHGNHGDSVSCIGSNALTQKTANGSELVIQACCHGNAELKGGTGGIGKTARFRCVFDGIKSNTP